MNTNRSLRLVKFAVLALLTACIGASLGNAQTVAGKFNLPFEVRWGQAVLPPGNYSFTLNSTSDLPAYTVVVRGEDRTASMITSPMVDNDFSGKSMLIVERHGERCMVRALRLPAVGLVIKYLEPRAERPVLAQAPVLIQRVPILMAGK